MKNYSFSKLFDFFFKELQKFEAWIKTINQNQKIYQTLQLSSYTIFLLSYVNYNFTIKEVFITI
jgi:hypothetical protein